MMTAASARRQIHLRFCKDIGACAYVGGGGDRPNCIELDRLLDLNDELLLHRAALDLMEEVKSMDFRGRRWRLTGAQWASTYLDPFERVRAPGDGPEIPDGYNPDCSACRRGEAHHHRKKDGSFERFLD
jgi:hypothetical protein